MNHLYYGDNLSVLRDHIADDSVDLIYLDPPFNSNASYNVLFRSASGDQSAAQIEAFDDTWHWGDEAETGFQSVRHSGHTDARIHQQVTDSLSFAIRMVIGAASARTIANSTKSSSAPNRAAPSGSGQENPIRLSWVKRSFIKR